MECYQYGNIRMFHGDCMEFMANVPDKHYELAIVDPPYGIGEAKKQRSFSAKNDKRWSKRKDNWADYQPKEWDNARPNGEFFSKLEAKSKNQIVWGGNYFFMKPSTCWIVWDKLNGDSDFADCELAWASFHTSVRKFSYMWAGMRQQNMSNKEKRIHPTQKPVALYRWLLENYAKPGDKILDTHGGSGSIVIACHALGFALDWIELDKDYYDAAVKRFKAHLGNPEEMGGTKWDAPPQLKMFTE